MCNCLSLPDAVAEVDYWDGTFPWVGVAQNPSHFELPDGDFSPPLSYSNHLYRCADCGQAWYLDVAPEEEAFPIFGLKLELPGVAPNPEEITAAKESLAVMAHGGLEVEQCRMAGCLNLSLLGRAFCQSHFRFP